MMSSFTFGPKTFVCEPLVPTAACISVADQNFFQTTTQVTLFPLFSEPLSRHSHDLLSVTGSENVPLKIDTLIPCFAGREMSPFWVLITPSVRLTILV